MPFSSGREDLNLRPSAPEADALPGCATPRFSIHAERAAFYASFDRMSMSFWQSSRAKKRLCLTNVEILWLCLTSVDILLSKDCHPGLELRAWSLERRFTTQSSKLKALSNEGTKSLEQGISPVVKHSLKFYPVLTRGNPPKHRRTEYFSIITDFFHGINRWHTFSHNSATGYFPGLLRHEIRFNASCRMQKKARLQTGHKVYDYLGCGSCLGSGFGLAG